MICFFLQEEDGIRDAQESRGLGDVYKRQLHSASTATGNGTTVECTEVSGGAHKYLTLQAVSYTHLTLPTIYSV